uniref:Uncharacterized protein n=1 Tax=Anopheles farauti TaxID=69004 RepID=A0A182Q214_9DIPT
MCDADILSAVKAGDFEALMQATNNREPTRSFGEQIDGNGWNILHHASMSKSLEVVKFVAEHFNPPVFAQDYEGLTPLALACEQTAPVEIICYLMDLEKQLGDGKTDSECVSPLYYAVLQNRLDLVQALTARGETVDDTLFFTPGTALYMVAIVTGNAQILKCLLDTSNPNAECPILSYEDGMSGMELFALRANYRLGDKIECFKILFNREHPSAKEAGGRYDVNDILQIALMSYHSTSLIPYFVETELRWEKRVPIRTLYRKLIENFEILALTVLCECGPVSTERQELNDILEEPYDHCTANGLIGDELHEMVRSAFVCENGNLTTAKKTLQLFEEFAAFTKTITLASLKKSIHTSMQRLFFKLHAMLRNRQMHSMEEYGLFERTVDCMVNVLGNDLDAIVEHILLQANEERMKPNLMLPFLKHCCALFMNHQVVDEEMLDSRLYQWLIHLYGTWRAVKCVNGKPIFELFSLKRLTRDVIRETVWKGVNVQTANKGPLFIERLQSFELPNELKEYLRYVDYSCLKHFMPHIIHTDE